MNLSNLDPATGKSLRLLFVGTMTLLQVVGIAVAQGVHLPLKKAAAATELPVGVWGPYSPAHMGPCYLASRKEAQLFSFPVVVGQQRDEILPIGSRTDEGRARLRPERVTLLRRGVGLSPVAGQDDARGPAPRARIQAADGEGLYWSAEMRFEPAPLAQESVGGNGGAGWGPGTALVSYFPAFAEPDTEGLLLRIAVTNRSDAPQTYFVDLLAGIETPSEGFSLADLQIRPDLQDLVVQHPKFDRVFALAANYAAHTYAVPAAYFDGRSRVAKKDAGGALLPGDGNTTAGKEPAKPWGLLRISGIRVAAGETRTLFLCIGLGRDSAAALHAAHTLLAQAEDRQPEGKAEQPGLASQAEQAHRKTRFATPDAALEHLMAQSMVNVPFQNLRRVGIPSRSDGAGTYVPAMGGWIALGWSVYRPDWSAAQLNAWFLSQNPPPSEVKHALAVPPIDLFAYWELVQQTHDRDILERFYPYAVARFQEFVAAGRVRPEEWLFAWPEGQEGGVGWAARRPAARIGKGNPAAQYRPSYAPDYSAYVIRAARILQACAKILERPPAEIDLFTTAIRETSQAMNTRLWDAGRSLYRAVPVSTPNPVPAADAGAPDADGIEGLLPLIAGAEAVPPDREAQLLKQLSNEASFWSPSGIRSLARSTSAYRPDDPNSGGIGFGAQWLLWKALLDRGEAERAGQLAARVLHAYHAAEQRSGDYPERLQAETGAPAGRSDFTGDACALLALDDSYHHPGVVSCGWETYLLDSHYDPAADTLRVVFRALAAEPKGVLLCAMAKPGGKYTLTGGVAGPFTADAQGVLTLPVPKDRTTQQVEIAPAGGAR